MGKIFLVLGLGFLIGYKGVLQEKGLRMNGRLQTAFLLLLIFCMGVSIGRNGEILRNLPLLGRKALLFAVFAILGSTLAVYFLSRLFLQKEGKR